MIMRATTIHGTSDVRLTEVPDPRIVAPTDAIVQVVAACICGSDLWAYRGVAKREPGQRIGHEFVGVVSDIGSDVTVIRPGDFVIAPFVWADGSCPYCAEGLFTSCPDGASGASPAPTAGRGTVRVPYADATLVRVPGGAPDHR